MHISLDSALGRQRRLNSVGESVLQIAPEAAAAYSLRSLTGGDPKVVRVRRGSDNHEQDFTASEVSSGALQDFVNAQVVAPLDIQALTATGRDGDFLIAKAAYSLRSLGTRQATLAATGDTVARADGKYVAQVRRSSDDALKSFTATEITDGTLLAFTNADYAKYTSDFSAGDDSWGGTPHLDDVTETGNIDGIGGLDDNLRLTIGSATSQHRAFRTNILPENQKINFSARVFIPSTNSVVDSIKIRDADGTIIIPSTTPAQDQWVTVTASNVTPTNNSGQLRLFLQDGGVDNFAGNGSDVIYLREITVTQVTSDGFARTWYDQSVTTQAGDTATGNHATQATAAEQPKIVDGGSLLNELDFDGTDDRLAIDFGTDLSQANSLFMVHQSDTTTSSLNEFFDSTSGASPRTLLDQSGSDYRMLGASSVGTGVAVTTDKSLIFALYNGASSLFAKNGTATSALNAGTADINQNSTLGSSGSRFYDGSMQEVIVYNSDQTDNRTAIEANIGEAYSIDLPSGVDPGFDQVDGFVETWYDQSGNSNDAIQTTANLQPVIVAAGVFQNGLKFDSDGSSSGPDFRTPISSVELSNDPTGHGGFALVWVGNVNEVQHTDTSNHSVLGNLRNVQSFPTGTIGITVIPKTGTTKFINEQGGSTSEEVQATNALTPGNFGVVFFGYEDAEVGPAPLLSVDGTVTTSGLSSMNSSSSNNIGIMMAQNSSGTIRYANSADGICKEVLLYTGDQRDKRVALETNIAAEYGITLS